LQRKTWCVRIVPTIDDVMDKEFRLNLETNLPCRME
jgi:hypothetical protein